MEFVYYVVRKKDNVILDGAIDMVNAINMAQQQGCGCLIMQACVITEVGQDQPAEESQEPQEFVQPDIIEDNIETETESEEVV
mgnify:CR=1 FL=1